MIRTSYLLGQHVDEAIYLDAKIVEIQG